MTKRADGKFQRNLGDFYPTPLEAVLPLLPHLEDVSTFAEPCAGDGTLVRHLEANGLKCTYMGDICTGQDAFKLSRAELGEPGCIITNPPYDRTVMHALIKHLSGLAPTWLLLEFDWFATLQSAPYVALCSDIVPIGRVRWIPNSPHVGFDNYAWALFDDRHADCGPPFLHIRKAFKLPVEPREPSEAQKLLVEWGMEIQRDAVREAFEAIKK